MEARDRLVPRRHRLMGLLHVLHADNTMGCFICFEKQFAALPVGVTVQRVGGLLKRMS